MLRATPGGVCIKLTTNAAIGKESTPGRQEKTGRWDRTVITGSSLGHFGPAADRVPSHASNLTCCADLVGAGNLQTQKPQSLGVVSMCWHCGCHTRSPGASATSRI